uniref:Uncharacterized protein n=1 Tax=Helianthus annuus TaxID=4232 RepID=A0A251TDV1_HELAN
MGHQEPFNLKHVAIGNQDFGRLSLSIQYFWWRYPWAFNCCELKTKSYVWEDG